MGEPVLKDARRVAELSGSAVPRSRYEDDFYAWLLEQAGLLRAGRFDDLDLDHVAEELEGLSKSEFAKLRSPLRARVMPMPRWDAQPEHRTPSWIFSIREQRRRLSDIPADNPGLKPRIEEPLSKAYPDARDWAANETHVTPDAFPAACPYAWQDIRERPFDLDSVKR